MEALNEAEFIVRRARKDNVMKSLVGKIAKEAKSVIDSLDEDTPKRVRVSSRTMPTSRSKQEGHCVRCGKSITYDVKAPYCPDCYSVWAKYKDPDYEEESCHQCGTPNELTTMNRPLCNSCYRKSRRN